MCLPRERGIPIGADTLESGYQPWLNPWPVAPFLAPLIFNNARPATNSAAAWMKMNGPVHDFDQIQKLVAV
jgi:hypothetical protein